ncbi:aminotransferase-like domain-containing protein [Ramlibacter alkalitolerans]|uniref:PLP-dependent aminotransferase family protein n=1 Tax=Ramlibacter alkalitolerans TaxID=2039631 RepID=A0ABS1JMR0_9BURK|nr:PLP-dependent aminotransferase family protein [Ramlibacter alkalitolerans]MBL0425176.1 PLP-dependent aminotransferase family protein [Ramlibacter alkalitolerans]
MKKYERLAQDIETMIAAGTLRAGDRLPSVRESVASRGVSPSTVFEAYYLLESRGAVEARPRAGYFVAQRITPRGQEPLLTQPTSGLREVAVNDLVLGVLGSVRQRDVIPLGSAFPNPALFPLDRLARGMGAAMRKLQAQEVLENLSPGNQELRRQIALRYVSTGTLASAEEIVVTSGAMEALNLCLQAVTRPGDVVAIEAPAFYGCLQALERLQLKAVEVATHPRHGVQVEALAAVLQQHDVKACWFMPTFQNPMGASMAQEQKKAMVELLTRQRVPLIEDDVYSELYFGMRRPLPAKSFDREGWVLHCSSFSKSLAPGYRIGWAAAGRFAAQVERLKLSSTLSVAVPSQVAVLHFLQHGAFDKHLRGLRGTLAAQQQKAVRLVAKHLPSGTRVTQPEGGYFLWLELPEDVDALQLHRLALSQNISLAPGHIFSADQRFRHHVRLNYGHPSPEQLEPALRTIGRLAARIRSADR